MLSTTFSKRTRSVASSADHTFSDVNLYMGSKTDQGYTYDVDSINQSLVTILGTQKGTRIFRPEFGGSLDDLLFEPMTFDVADRIRDEIKSVLYKWEPRMTMTYLQVNMNIMQQHYQVIVEYKVPALDRTVNFSFLMSKAAVM